MTKANRNFLTAAIEILSSTERPLTAREITAEALKRGLLLTAGKTPEATMSARLYVALARDPNCPVRRVAEPARARARRGSVRWTLAP
jgi:hypothetical protein